MPHIRTRYLSTNLNRALKASPIVGILGQRQTGKTTLTQSLCAEYATLDFRKDLDAAETTPETWISGRKTPFGIDECQLAPALFPALKEHVRQKPTRGSFILTGSVRFTSRKQIRESLTGRILNLQLLPFSVAEAYGRSLPCTAIDFLEEKNFTLEPLKSSLGLKLRKFLLTGGMPGICFSRDDVVRSNYFETQLDTLIQRDLRLVYSTTLPFRVIRSILVWIALHQGESIDYSEIARFAQTSALSAKKILTAMEAIFLIRIFSIEGGVRAPIAFMEDQGMATYLAADHEPSLERLSDLNRGLFANLLPQFIYRPELGASFFQYRTRGGANVPLAFRSKKGTVGIISVVGKQPTPSAIKSAESFLNHYRQGKVIISCTESKEIRFIEKSLAVFPLLSLI